jgi:hypothetical protein
LRNKISDVFAENTLKPRLPEVDASKRKRGGWYSVDKICVRRRRPAVAGYAVRTGLNL